MLSTFYSELFTGQMLKTFLLELAAPKEVWKWVLPMHQCQSRCSHMKDLGNAFYSNGFLSAISSANVWDICISFQLLIPRTATTAWSLVLIR